MLSPLPLCIAGVWPFPGMFPCRQRAGGCFCFAGGISSVPCSGVSRGNGAWGKHGHCAPCPNGEAEILGWGDSPAQPTQ